MLSVRQALVLTTRRSVPPWRVSEWRAMFNVNQALPLSVRALIAGLEQQKLVLFVEARGISLLKTVRNIDELRAKWKDSPGITRTDLEALATQLAPHGVSIKFVSHDRRVLGLSGVVGPSTGVPTLRITGRNIDGARDVASGAGLAAGGVVVIVGGATTFNPFLIGAGFIIAGSGGFLIGLGLGELGVGESGEPPPEASLGTQEIEGGTITLPETTVYGSAPPDVDADNVIDLPPVEINDLPEEPPPEYPPVD